MADLDLNALLAEATRLALLAGAEIMTYYKGDMNVRKKSDASPVTAADEAAEALILPGLRAATPDIPVVAEEEMADGRRVDVGDRPFWLVDPLDGTKEFVAHRDEFTVNIALIVDGAPALGVVYAPALDVIYGAAGPGTATVRHDGGPVQPIATRAVPAAGMTVIGSRSHANNEKTDALLRKFTVADYLSAGSSIKFCLLAEGKADLYPRFGPTREWDTAAGHAVLAGAGGTVLTPDGAPFLYAKPDFLNGEFIAWGRTG